MRVAYLVSGAAGMYCGSCMRDNRLAATLIRQGRDVTLLPIYTPIRTDEPDVSSEHVFFGGVNVYLQQKSALFRHSTPLLDRLIDSPTLLRGVSHFASSTSPADLGALTVSMLKGADGELGKELHKLIAGLRAIQPTLIHLPFLMLAGLARPLREALHVPIVCAMTGEDIFLDALREPWRSECFDLIRRSTADIAAFIAPTRYYRDHCISHFGVPAERTFDVPMGILVDDFGRTAPPPDAPTTIGYFARICPEKGVGVLCEAFAKVRARGRSCRLRIGGYLGKGDRKFWNSTYKSLEDRGLAPDVDFVGETDRAGKIAFLHSLHLFSVPAQYHEAKGLYVLEALAAGVPAVLPRHGSFPELLEATGGGILYDGGADALADTLEELLHNAPRRADLSARGTGAVGRLFNETVMANRTWEIFQRVAASDTKGPLT